VVARADRTNDGFGLERRDRRGDARRTTEALLERLCEIGDRTRRSIGLEVDVEVKSSSTPPIDPKTPLAFTADPNAKSRHFVSDAWADAANSDHEKDVNCP
jgi:hypothetical protein